MQQITLRVDANTKESLEGEAEDEDTTLSDYLRTLIRTRHDDDESERVRELEERNRDLREELAEQRGLVEDLRADRERMIRLEGEVERVEDERDRLQDELEGVRGELQVMEARYTEANTKLKLHNSEKENRGPLARLRGWFGGD